MNITTTQSTFITVTHNTEKDTLTDLYELIDNFRQDTGYAISLPIQSWPPTRTVIHILFLDVSPEGVADDSFYDSVLLFQEKLEDSGFRNE